MKQWTLLFPGQGSQAPNMGRWLFDEFKVAREIFEEGSEALKQDLKKLIFEGSEADLALTENTQPALLCVSTATQKVIRQLFELPVNGAAGHSIGEYAALVAAGTLNFSEAMRAVRTRGQAMQSAVPVGKGGMTAVLGLDDEQIKWVCDYAVKGSGKGPVSPANFNSPGQIVISGSMDALNWLKDHFKPEEIPGSPRRAKLIPLSVSAPFHCEMMKPAEDKMREVLTASEFKNPAFPICQNLSATLETKPSILRENLIRQVSAPVLWTQSMAALKASSMTNCVECGHGSVLKGLLKKIDSEAFTVFNMQSLQDLKAFEATLKTP